MTGLASAPVTLAAASPRPRRRWIWVLVALATSAVLVVPVALRVALKAGIHHAYLPVVTYRHPITELDVQTGSGGFVTIAAGRAGQVTVSRSLAWLIREPGVAQVWRHGTLDVGATCPKFNPFEDCEVNVTIAVPPGTAVQAAAGAGSIVVSGVSGSLHLSASSGQIQASDVSGPLWATASSGSVVARQGVTSARVFASVTTGQIALRLQDQPRQIELVIGTGSAAVSLPPGSRYRIASSVGGTLSVAPGLNDPRSDDTLTIGVGSGTARIGYWKASG